MWPHLKYSKIKRGCIFFFQLFILFCTFPKPQTNFSSDVCHQYSQCEHPLLQTANVLLRKRSWQNNTDNHSVYLEKSHILKLPEQENILFNIACNYLMPFYWSTYRKNILFQNVYMLDITHNDHSYWQETIIIIPLDDLSIPFNDFSTDALLVTSFI